MCETVDKKKKGVKTKKGSLRNMNTYPNARKKVMPPRFRRVFVFEKLTTETRNEEIVNMTLFHK